MQVIQLKPELKDKLVYGLFSDTHIDSKGCDTKKLKADMQSVVDQGGRLWFNGDIFSAILPQDRKRRTAGCSIFNSDAELNEIVEYGVEFFKPYAKYIDFIGLGNHECSVMKWNGFNPVAMLIFMLNKDCGTDIKAAGYKDFIQIQAKVSSGILSFTVLKDHGKGGSSPVTKGMIDFSRYSNYNYDLLWIGHKHTAIVNYSDMNISVNGRGRIVQGKKLGIITPGYQKPVSQKDKFVLNYSEERFHGTSAMNGFGILELSVKRDEIDVKYIDADLRVKQ